jgi:hypothetical protein
MGHFLGKADLIDGALPTRCKSVLRCKKNGVGMVTEGVTFNRPESNCYKMTKGPLMFKRLLGS